MLRREDREIRNDSNGNAILAEDKKESVMRIISDTLRRPRSRESDCPYTVRDDDDYLESNTFLDNNSLHNYNSDDMLEFNPGDRLSSPVPPLAPQSDLSSPGKLDYIIRNHLKDCHLSSVLNTARRCVKQLSSVKKGLTFLISQDERLSQGKKIPNPGSDYELISKLGECVMILTRQAFTPAHQMYTAALGLHLSEDLIRNPLDPTLLDFKTGYIIRAPWTSIIHTQMKLRACVDSATEIYHRFGRDNATCSECHRLFQAEQMQNVIILLMHAFQDLYASALGCNDIFKVLLHIEDYGEKILQDFLISLESIERSELLIQVQNLRRSFDDIVIKLEQLSWAAYVVFRLANGKSVTPSPDSSFSKITGKREPCLPEDLPDPADSFDDNECDALAEVTVTRPRSRESRNSSSRLTEHKQSVSSSRERSHRGYSSDQEDIRYQLDSEKQLKSSMRKERSSLGPAPSPRSRRASPSAMTYERSDENTLLPSKHSSKSSSKSSIPSSSLKHRGSKSKYITNESASPYQDEDSRGKKHKTKLRSSSLDGRGYRDDYNEGKTSGSISYGASAVHRSKSKDKSYRGSTGESRNSDYAYRKSKS